MASRNLTPNLCTNKTLPTSKILLWRNTSGHKIFAAWVLPDKSSTHGAISTPCVGRLEDMNSRSPPPLPGTSFLTSGCRWVPQHWPLLISTLVNFWSNVIQHPCFGWAPSWYYYISYWATDSYTSCSLLCICLWEPEGLLMCQKRNPCF